LKHTSATYTAYDIYVGACACLEVAGGSLYRQASSLIFQIQNTVWELAQRAKRELLILSESYVVTFDQPLIFPFFHSYQEIQVIKSCDRLIQSHKSEWEETRRSLAHHHTKSQLSPKDRS